jgi:hypothetical protein
MGYKTWFESHGKKHAEIMKKLTHLSDAEVIEYFLFENMIEKEPHFCPLYKEHKKCHDLEKLNCYLCACPNFRFDDEGFKELKGKSLKSYCHIDSKDGAIFEGEDAIHQNCAACAVPHQQAYIEKHFNRDWFESMKDVAPYST